MKARPILMSAPMIQALLERRKSQTRRIAKFVPLQPWYDLGLCDHAHNSAHGHPNSGWVLCSGNHRGHLTGRTKLLRNPYGVPGDLLWVREAFGRHFNIPEFRGWVADGWRATANHERQAPSIHLPRAWSRLTLRITDVSLQRLHWINEKDARAEGASFHDGRGVGHSGWRHDHGDVHDDARSAYARLWESINGAGSWAKNPWTWALTFETIKRNVDQVIQTAPA